MNWLFSGMSQGGTKPCIACLWRPSDGFNNTLPCRSFGDNSRNAAAYCDATDSNSMSAQERAVKNFNNCVRQPALTCAPHVLVGDVLTPNPLHMKLRCTNKILGHFKTDAATMCAAYIDKLGLRHEQYHGELEGRSCSKVVERYETLRELVLEECQRAAEKAVAFARRGAKQQRISRRSLRENVATRVLNHPASRR